MYRLYSYSGCSTCRKALAWLRQRGLTVNSDAAVVNAAVTDGTATDPVMADVAVDVAVIDIISQPPSLQELAEALVQLGRQRLFNTSGQRYRALGAATVRAYSDAQALEALAADGRLVKRPFLVSPAGTILTGFQPQEWEALFPPPP